MKIHIKNIVSAFIFLTTFVSISANANTVSCGLKTITLNGSNITKIIHEDGTIHTGRSISENWSYDGKSIKHRLIDDPIPCGNAPKNRDEVIKELSSSFTKNPKIHGMSKEEAKLMSEYSANLMRNDSSCHLLVDGAKSKSDSGSYYIDCNDKNSKTRRYWLSEKELKNGILKKALAPVSSQDAISICNEELKSRVSHPSSYDPSLVLGTSNKSIERNGRNVVEISFKASNALGVIKKYKGSCVLEAGSLIDISIKNQ